MTMPTYFLTLTSAGAPTGSGYTPDGTLPPGAMPCSQAQAESWPRCTVTSGAVTMGAPAAPTLAQQAATALAAGLTITSTATAALDATYPASALAQQQINAEVTSILLNGTFADGTATIGWLDVTGASHAYTIAQFKTLATAIGAFVSGCVKCINGQVTTLPSASTTIP